MTTAPFVRARSIDEAVAGRVLRGTERDNALVETKEPVGFFACCGGQARIASDHEGAHRRTQACLDGLVDLVQRQFVAAGELASNGGFAGASHSDQHDKAHARMPI